MNFERLKKNIADVTKEAQLKLGYERVPFGINYTNGTLAHLLGTDCNERDIKEALNKFIAKNEYYFGTITYKEIDGGVRLTIPEKGVEAVHKTADENKFLADFLKAVRNPASTIDDIIAVFKKYGNDVTVKKADGRNGFDYLIYFDSGEPDEFWYCIDTEDLGMTYHRFIKEDYLDFGF